MSKISVLMPAYNSEKTIKKTIESVLKQTFSDFELIIINDGSTDLTLAEIESIKDKRLQVFTHTHSGASATRNQGIALLKGDFISFIDADDIWTPDKLDLQFKALQEHPEAAVAYSWTDCVDENYNFLRSGSHITFNGDVYQQLLLRDFIESGSNPLIRQEAIKEVGGFDISLGNANDWDMWIRLAALYQFVAVPSVQILYRVSTNSLSNNIWRMEACSLKIIERECNYHPQKLQTLKKDILANRYKYLTFKALEGMPSSKKGLASMRFFLLALRYDPNWIIQIKIIFIIISKIVILTFLPPQVALALLKSIKFKVQKTETFLNIQTNVNIL